MAKINEAGLDLIKEFEGCKLKAYKCPAGVWTVGYGLTSRAGFIKVEEGTTITQAEADYYMEQVVQKFAGEIAPHITAPINENEMAAFTSLAYNIGTTAFKKSSALKHFNAGDKLKAAYSITLWNKAGGKVLKGLERRRAAEKELFLTPVEWVPPAVEIEKPNALAALIQLIVSFINSLTGGKK